MVVIDRFHRSWLLVLWSPFSIWISDISSIFHYGLYSRPFPCCCFPLCCNSFLSLLYTISIVLYGSWWFRWVMCYCFCRVVCPWIFCFVVDGVHVEQPCLCIWFLPFIIVCSIFLVLSSLFCWVLQFLLCVLMIDIWLPASILFQSVCALCGGNHVVQPMLFGCWIIASLWNLTGAWVALLPMLQSNFRVIGQF